MFTGGYQLFTDTLLPGRVVQPVTCLALDASLTADPGIAKSDESLGPSLHSKDIDQPGWMPRQM